MAAKIAVHIHQMVQGNGEGKKYQLDYFAAPMGLVCRVQAQVWIVAFESQILAMQNLESPLRHPNQIPV
jgi:hypothetical protein